MLLREEYRDLFSVNESSSNADKYYLVHCIACNAYMNRGIAVTFVEKFPKIKSLRNNWEKNKVGSCIRIGKVFNLITKKRSWNKPTIDTLNQSLIDMKTQCITKNIKK